LPFDDTITADSLLLNTEGGAVRVLFTPWSPHTAWAFFSTATGP
jgi:hypothetical protein